jgi:hypothetical protein
MTRRQEETRLLVERHIFRTLRLWCVLLLVTIFGHALLPVGSPASAQSGSPFSASTVDVSTGLDRRPVAIEKARRDFDPDDRINKPQSAPQLAASDLQPILLAMAALPNGNAWSKVPAPMDSDWRTGCSMPRAPPYA